MFLLTELAIEHGKEAAIFDDPRAGGIVYFDGRVRNHNEGHSVRSLEYQSYEEMALKVGEQIVSEAREKFDVHELRCIHRLGHLAVGDIAVWVGASASHRADAFKACQYIIDEVKLRVPIWKKEHYVDRPAKWVACHQCAHHGHQHTEQVMSN